MGISIVRFSSTAHQNGSWGVLSEQQVFPLALEFEHHRDLMDYYFSRRSEFDAAISGSGVDVQEIKFQAPLSKRIQMFAQGLNYASHRVEGGMSAEVEDEENLVFYKASSSICGPNDDIVRPVGCELLDYEIELGLILKRDITDATTVTDSNLSEYVGAMILCNDVSSRDIQFGAPVMQWFKGKSYRSFCPCGPVLYLMDAGDFAQLYDMELVLKMNGEVRQQSTTDLLIHKPPKTLTDISEYADLYSGDCILTGTPGGVIAGVNLKVALAIVLNFKNDKKRRLKFTAAQKSRATFLQPGDVLDLTLKSRDGAIDLGSQHGLITEAP
jgi:2-keto-4-pentenoate hydratase/2-oxohepta-3-ene-1,7-dioic acid hydratase in catechol pathway